MDTNEEIATERKFAEEVNRSIGRRVTREVLIVALFYFLYSVTRNVTGSTTVNATTATLNAERLTRLERTAHLFHEAAIQHHFVHQHWLLWMANVFYGSAHFVITIGLLIWLFIAVPNQYRFWRNILAVTTAMALVGFVLFPLLPPRLLSDPSFHFPQSLLAKPSFHFVDTLKTVGGLWNFESGPINKVSNQYAAMPSLHFGWSSWCGLVLITLGRRRWVRIFGAIYPLLTLFCIVVTANHYIFDAIGGAGVLVIGILVSRTIEMTRAREDRRFARAQRINKETVPEHEESHESSNA